MRHLDALGMKDATIVSYDIKKADAAARSAVERLVYGRRVEMRVNGSRKVYEYPGLVHEGARRLGQSVVIMEPDLASRLIMKLREHRVPFTIQDVAIPH
jgi:hypothetical protein